MQYGTKMLNNWQQLKLQHPTQINAVTIVDDAGNQGTFMHIRTVLFNYLTRREIMTNPELDKYREKQHTSSIDTLTNQLKAMELDIKQTEASLEKKVNECDITKDVLRMKLEDTLNTLHLDVKPEKMSATMLSAQDLNDLGIDTHTDEPVRKISHEKT